MSRCLPMPDLYSIKRVEKVRNEINWNLEKQPEVTIESSCAIIRINYQKTLNEAGRKQMEGTTKILVSLDDDIRDCDCVCLTNCLWENLWEFEVISRDTAYKSCIAWMSHREVLLNKVKNDRL